MIGRRLFHTGLLFSALLLASTAAHAQVSCTAAPASQQSLRQEGFTEPASDIIISCTGSPTSFEGVSQSLRLSVDNTAITSRALGGTQQQLGAPTEAALLTNDCTSNGLSSGSGCQPAGTYSGGNPIQGFLQNGVLVFTGISFPVAGTPFTYRITNLRVAANQLAAGATVTASLQASFTLQNTQSLAIGTVQKSLSVAVNPPLPTLQQCQTPGSINLVISELFNTAFKSPRVSTANDQPGQWYQTVNSESQFAFVNWNQAEWSNPSASLGIVPGQADTATRIRVNFSNIPANVTLSLPSSLSTPSGTLIAISSDTGPTSLASGPITISSPSGSVTYEVQAQSRTAIDSFNVPISVSYTNTPDLGTIQVGATYVPTTTESTTNYPYFADTSSTTTPLASIVTCLSLTSLIPSTVPANSPQFTLQVKGAGFTPASVISFNGTLLSTLYQDTATLLAVVPASLLTNAGSVPVTVVQQGVPTPTPLTFIISAPLSLSSLSPSSTGAGGPQFILTLNGTGFTTQTSAFFGSTQLTTTLVNSNQLTAIVPAALTAQAATVPVTARTGSLTSNALNFIVTGPSLTLTSISPNSVAAGSAAFVLTATGTGFTAGSSITVNGSALSSTFISPTQLSTTIPANFIASPGTLAVSIFQQGFTPPPSLPLTVTTSFSLTSITPSSANAGGPQFTLLASGTGFNSGTVLFFNSTALATQFMSSGQLSATVPAALITQAGAASVTANNSGISSNALPFQIVNGQGLTLTSISPNTALAGSPAFTMILTGSGFNAGTLATFNGTALSTSFVNANQLTALVPATAIATAGTAAVGVTSAGQTSPPTLPFTITTPALTLTSLAPSTIASGAQAFTMGVTGTAFTSSTIILWNGAALPTTFGSSTSLSVAVPATLVANAGTATVTAQNGSIISNGLTFTISAPPPPPVTLTSVSPNTAPAGSPALTITVNGSGFVPPSGTAITFNGTTLTTTVVSRNQLIATVPASLLANPGNASVSVTGSQPTPPSLPFIITTGPILTSISPSSTTAGGPGLTLLATGSGFTSGTALNLNGTALVTTFISPTQLSAAIGATQIQQPGILSVTASNGTQVSNSLPFNVLPPTPVITSLSPSTAVTGSAALSMTIAGSGFLPTSTASWNAISLPVSFVSATQLTAAVSKDLLSAPGTANVVVANGALVSNAAVFTVTPPAPVITSISPASGVAGAAAFTLNVSGTGFQSGATVSFNGTNVNTSFISATQLTAAITADLIARAGKVPVTASNPNGGTSNAVTFTIAPPTPTITSLSPSSVTAGGPAFTLTVNGTNFLAGAVVSINGNALVTTDGTATQLTAQVTANQIAQPGPAQITVANIGGQSSAPATLAINPGAPTLTSISPISAKVGDPTFTLAVTGTGFVQGSVVQWDGSPLATTFVSNTQLTATIAAGRLILPATASVTVVNAVPGGSPLVSNALTFTINPVLPTITSISPNSATAGDPAFSLTVTGTGFINLTTIQFNSTALTTHFVSATQVTADVPTTALNQAGAVSVTAVNPGNNVSNAVTFTVNPGTPAVLTSLSKTTATAGDAAFTLTITGTGFRSGAVANLGTTALSTTFVSATQLTAAVPATALTTAGTLQVTVQQFGTTSNGLPFVIAPLGPPSLRLVSPGTITPGQQTTIDFGLNSPYPLALTGTVTLTFVSNATVPIDDPMIQLATGGRTFTFTVPANTTTLPALQLQTGTVAGTITVAVTFSAGGVNVTPASGNSITIVVPKAPPVLISGKVKLIHQNGYLEVDITGFSTTRDMTSATFHLNPVAGGSFTSSDFTVPLSALFTTWYQSAASTAFGSQFSYAQPFTVIGDTNQVQSVTVTLTNSAGASVSMTTN